MFGSPSSLAFVTLASLASAIPLLPAEDKRQNGGGLQALQGSITTLQLQLATANNTVADFSADGIIDGITGLIKVNSAVVQLGDDITKTTQVANDTTRLSATDSTTVGLQFLGVQPDITRLLTNLDGKKPDFDKAGLKILDVRSLIRDSVSIQQTNAKTLGSSLINALDPSLAGIAQPINDQIQGNFTATVNAFQGRGGAIKIPTKLVPALSDILDGLGRALGISDDTSSSGGGKGAKGAEVDTNSNLLMPQISQSDLDKLGPDENDWSLVPFPVAVALRRFGFDG
ncbi:ntigenic cell wall [Diaporthe amygdali]|uniref:ntigenic cell wall n=1 Tax=Phomopsis amygdali TaxID=1214568 RepID=UPI0022FECC0F|nr:ntigenic cell wall [Diaporthe amygdali]KAJ0114133.1 ntigenic cell wall [Diaporthe amygdali]